MVYCGVRTSGFLFEVVVGVVTAGWWLGFALLLLCFCLWAVDVICGELLIDILKRSGCGCLDGM